MASSVDSRGLSVHTPLAPNALFLTGFRGHEALSSLFQFQLELMAENRQSIAFDKLIGQPIAFSISLPDGKTSRSWSGICSSFAEAHRDSTFTTYRMEVVPQFWMLTRRIQCRIFQHQSIPDILKKVLAGIDCKLELQGTFEPRDYCVQYRESDFAFASRLMEEEGISYFFRHGAAGHQMVLGNSPVTFPAVAFSEKAVYEDVNDGNRADMRVTRWEKYQELRSGKVTLWDHCFELPNQHLDAERPTAETVEIGKVSHKLKLPANESLEIFDYPGGYAGRFDGVDRGGGDQSANLNKIFQDNKRTASIRMEQEAAQAILIRGSSNCRQFAAGHKFALERHFNADGAYFLTSVQHSASASQARSGGGDSEIVYRNDFTCLPMCLPFRPPQVTPRPKVAGLQTAQVVGPRGEEIHTDKYGRVKVQFPWDRQGKHDADSSCWIRVATIWAGKGYGVIHIPRIGQEVVVNFMEGDPDQPVIIGSVYNAENMPAAELPKNKMVSGLKSANYPGGGGFNGMVCDDTKNKQMVAVHAQYDMQTTVEHDDTVAIKTGNHKFTVETGTASYEVKGAVTETFHDTQNTAVENTIDIKTLKSFIHVDSPTEIKLSVGKSSITILPDQIVLHTDNVIFEGVAQIKGVSPQITFAADVEAKMGAPLVSVKGTQEALFGVGSQSVKCDTAAIAVAGAEVNCCATGNHVITGSTVKIN